MFVTAGLKKLLSEHPALFTIDDELVYLNTFESSSNSDQNADSGAEKSDYIQNTKDYYKHKMLRYGIGNEIPLVSLQGHRSQAPPHIRHIAGKCLFYIKFFLLSYNTTSMHRSRRRRIK